MTSTRHRWGEKKRFPLANKSERECARCHMAQINRREYPGGREIFWTEYWRDGERVAVASGKTPPCDARVETAQQSSQVPA